MNLQRAHEPSLGSLAIRGARLRHDIQSLPENPWTSTIALRLSGLGCRTGEMEYLTRRTTSVIATSEVSRCGAALLHAIIFLALSSISLTACNISPSRSSGGYAETGLPPRGLKFLSLTRSSAIFVGGVSSRG